MRLWKFHNWQMKPYANGGWFHITYVEHLANNSRNSINRGVLWHSHDAMVLVPSDNLGNVECAVGEGCRLLLSSHCGHFGHLLCQLGEVTRCGAMAHRVNQQHLMGGGGVRVQIDIILFLCAITLHLGSIDGEYWWSLAHVYPAFTVKRSL